jgi:hypothetical protein
MIEDEAMVYYDKEPDVPALSKSYLACTNDLGFYFDQCRRNYDDRRNQWIGKSYDLRKSGADAFPWPGASDQEVHVIGERLDARVALAVTAMSKSNIKAHAVKMQSMERASMVSAFAKWMRTSYIRDFDTQHELVCNYGDEKGIMITYVGWEKRERTFKQEMDLKQIKVVNPEIAAMIEGGEDDDEIAAMLQVQWPKLRPGRAKKCLRQLRAKGHAELYVSRSSPLDSRPFVKACSPDGEVFFPPYCMDPQRAPYVFWRQVYTAQEIENFVAAEGWDRKWADYVLKNCAGMGVNDLMVDTQYQPRTNGLYPTDATSNDELYVVVRAYQRLIDEEDGSEGIYCTAFSPHFTGEGEPDIQGYAKRELLNGYDQYPFAVTRMSADQSRMYDLQALPEKLRGAQWQVKVERDSRIDRNSLATLPPREGPPGRQPSEWGPGRYIPVRKRGEIGYIESPGYNPGSNEIEQTTLKMADAIASLDPENPLTPVRQQFFVNKTLQHGCAVLKLAYTCFQRFGPDEIFFNVTGVPDPIQMTNVQDDEFDITITFDTLSNDPENAKAQAEFFSLLIQADKTGRLDAGRHTEFMARSVNSAYADYVLLPADENSQKLQRAITDDFAKLYSGVAVGPQPNGAQITLQMLQAWMQEPDVGERMQSDEPFANRVTNYAKQAQFQIQQAQNAETGKIGTAPVTFQNTNLGAA